MQKFDFKSITVGYDDKNQFIYVNYHGPSESEDFRAAWNKTLEILKEHRPNKWLINQKKQSIFVHDQEWLAGEWLQQSMAINTLSADNPRFIATIQPDNFFAEFSTSKFIKENSSDALKVNVFKSENDALKWLEEVSPVAK